MKQNNLKKQLRVSSETIRQLSVTQLGQVDGGQFIPSKQILPTVCLACQN